MCKKYASFYFNQVFDSARIIAVIVFMTVAGVTVSAFAEDPRRELNDLYASGLAPLDVVSNTKLDSAFRYKAFEDVLKLDGDLRKRTLRRIIMDSDGEFGCLAIRILTSDNPLGDDFTDIVLNEFRRWDNLSRQALLQDLSYAPKPRRFRSVAKTILEAMLSEQGLAQATQEEIDTLAGRASELLCWRNDCPSKDLVLSAIKAFPTSRKTWLAAAIGNVLDEEGTAIAIRVYQNDRNPMRTRMAAATANAHRNADAHAFVLDELNAFFVKYGDVSLADIVNTKDIYKDREAARRFFDFVERLETLEVLKWLDSDSASEVVFSHLASKNERISQVLILIASMRWPERLLTWLEGNPELHADAKVLALIAMKNPEFEARCMRLGDDATIRKETNGLKKADNPSAFFSTLGIFISGL